MSLAGKLLIATPKLDDTAFAETVVLVTDHDTHGARGYVLNKPSATTVEDLFEHLAVSSNGMHYEPVYMAGPVSERHIHMIHSSEWYSSSTVPVTTSIAVSRDGFMFEKMDAGSFPSDWLITVGYSAWDKGQLENEIERNDWLTLPATPELVFASKTDKLWDVSVTLCGQQMIDNYF